MTRTFPTAVLSAVVLVLATFASFAASQFEGKWKVTDSAGKAFEITLASDGSATANRGEGMTGTWKEDDGAALITWNTGWTTKISKDGDKFTKSAFKKGDSPDAKPANTSPAEKAN